MTISNKVLYDLLEYMKAKIKQIDTNKIKFNDNISSEIKTKN